MSTSEVKLYNWRECSEFGIETIAEMYREYVSASQVDLIGSFGFGRTSMVKADGMYIYTATGTKILDFTGGIGVLNHGHNHPRILGARIEYQRQKRVRLIHSFSSAH